MTTDDGTPRRAIVTGAGRGIGRACAVRPAELGHDAAVRRADVLGPRSCFVSGRVVPADGGRIRGVC